MRKLDNVQKRTINNKEDEPVDELKIFKDSTVSSEDKTEAVEVKATYIGNESIRRYVKKFPESCKSQRNSKARRLIKKQRTKGER